MPQPELRTERLLLRPFREDDVSDALGYRNDAEFSRFLPHVPYPFTRADAERLVAVNMSEDWRQSPTFAVVLSGRLIGTTNLEVDHESRSAMLGYAVGSRWWGQGLAAEAARASNSRAYHEAASHRTTLIGLTISCGNIRMFTPIRGAVFKTGDQCVTHPQIVQWWNSIQRLPRMWIVVAPTGGRIRTRFGLKYAQNAP